MKHRNQPAIVTTRRAMRRVFHSATIATFLLCAATIFAIQSPAQAGEDGPVSSADLPGPTVPGRPDNPSIKAYNRAVKLTKRKEYPAALKSMKRAFKAARFSEETIGLAYSNLCLIQFKIGDDEKAEEACKMALIWLPNYVPATLNMARIKARMAGPGEE